MVMNPLKQEIIYYKDLYEGQMFASTKTGLHFKYNSDAAVYYTWVNNQGHQTGNSGAEGFEPNDLVYINLLDPRAIY